MPAVTAIQTAKSVPGGRGIRYIWTAVAIVVALAGFGAAAAAAMSVARSNAEASTQTLQRSSEQIASTLQLAIEHQNDLVINAGAYVLSNPQGTQQQFITWSSTARVLERHPELRALTEIEVVLAADLPRYLRRVTPPGDRTLAVTPPGDRPSYCFIGRALPRSAAAVPANVDVCAPVGSAAVLTARDSGKGSYEPFDLKGDTFLLIRTPVYSGGAIPTTVQERRAQFVSITATLVSPTAILDTARRGFDGLSVSLHFRSPSSHVTFTRGATTGTAAVTQDLGGGWTTETTGRVLNGAILSDADATWLFLAIALTGLLLGILLFVLATGRERARVQLLQRTGQLKHQALHDALTGLPNRTLVEDRMEQMLIRARRHRTTGAALFLDIDDFKNVNDTLGHAVGDRLLVAVTERLAGALRDADTVGRMGGDEFVVLVDGTDGEVSPEMVAQRLLDVMQVPFVLDGVHSPVVVSMSIGVAAGDRTTSGDLLRDADLALYEAKAAGKNQYRTFDADMHTDLTRRTDLEFDLRSALPGDQYRLMYQPMYDLGDLDVVGVEALLRWDHPTLGTISPEEFIPLLEKSGQIVEVGRWVLNEACQQMADWHARGDTLDLSVNVSGRQLDYPGIVDDVREAIDRSGLAPDSLIVEITESVLMYNVENTTQRLHEIKRLGVRVAIDDFGTGYSSLAYLSTFPVDCLKIDRAFTSAITTSEQSRALVHTLVRMAKDLGLSTLAEGIETTGEMDLVRAADVDQAQGFLMAKPLDPAVLEAQLLLPMRAAHAADPT